MCRVIESSEEAQPPIEVVEAPGGDGDGDEVEEDEYSAFDLRFIDVIQNAKNFGNQEAVRHFLHIRVACKELATEIAISYYLCKTNPARRPIDPELDIASAWMRTYASKRIPYDAVERFDYFYTLYVLYNTLRFLHVFCVVHFDGVRSPSRAADNEQDILCAIDQIYYVYHMYAIVNEPEPPSDEEESDEEESDEATVVV
jgi:hypothetical protein